MIYARVVGNTVSSAKHASYEGRKLMVVEPIGLDGKKNGGDFLAVDAVQAGPGDEVLVAREGNAARQILDAGSNPIHAVILAIVDEIDTDQEIL